MHTRLTVSNARTETLTVWEDGANLCFEGVTLSPLVTQSASADFSAPPSKKLLRLWPSFCNQTIHTSALPSGGEGSLSTQEGDMIVLAEPAGVGALQHDTCMGRNERTGKAGSLQSDSLYILPTITKPTDDMLVSPQLLQRLKQITPCRPGKQNLRHQENVFHFLHRK